MPLHLKRRKQCQPKKSLKENPFQFTKNEVKLTYSNLEVKRAFVHRSDRLPLGEFLDPPLVQIYL